MSLEQSCVLNTIICTILRDERIQSHDTEETQKINTIFSLLLTLTRRMENPSLDITYYYYII